MRDIKDILGGMTEFEIAQLYYMVKNQVSTDGAILVSFFFAYLAVAHFTAKSLSTMQVACLTIIYSAIVLFSIITIYQDVLVASAIGAYQTQVEPQTIWAVLMTSLFVMGWALSVVYMMQVRRKHDI